MGITAVLTDIEGTTSSISFVHETLFPYSSKHLPTFMDENFDNPKIRPIIQEIEKISGSSLATSQDVTEILLSWIGEDRKYTPLKTLQGLIWEAGYKSGKIKGHIYEDAFRGLSRWKRAGLSLHVYSSGSVYAQKLLFGHTEYGDLTPLFSSYFDTNIGNKRSASSYTNILDALNKDGSTVVFLSDVVDELTAASQTGMKVVLLDRAQEYDSSEIPKVKSFDELDRIWGLAEN
jgi:enolase-phosphatase E1